MSGGKVRLSGYQYRKRKFEKDAERQKQVGALDSFITKGVSSAQTETLDTLPAHEQATNSVALKSQFEPIQNFNITTTDATATTSTAAEIQRRRQLSSSSEDVSEIATTNLNTILTSDPAT